MLARNIFLLFLISISPVSVVAQKGLTTVGIQVKPIFSLPFLGTGKITNDTSGVRFETSLSSGFSAGLVVRHNFTKLVAFETGINYVKRKYSLKISESDYTKDSKFRIIGYEIPVMLMIYAQLGEKIYINGSMGPVIDMYASDIQVIDTFYNNTGFRNQLVVPSVAANIGWEYRTEKDGTFYLGASFHRPFEYIYLSRVYFKRNNTEALVRNELSGTYLTIDFRYFFPAVKSKLN